MQARTISLQTEACAEAAADPGRLRKELQRNKEKMKDKLAQYRAPCDLIKRDYEHLNYEDQQLCFFRERVRTTRKQLEKEQATTAQYKEYVEAQRRKHSIKNRDVDSLRAEHEAPRVYQGGPSEDWN